MENTSNRLSYRPEDDMPLAIDALSAYARVSRAFIRLCIALGCPAPEGKLSQSAMIEWLTGHYVTVRRVAGLRSLAPLDGTLGSSRRTLELANTMLTLLEFAESRSSNLSEKANLRKLIELLERTV